MCVRVRRASQTLSSGARLDSHGLGGSVCGPSVSGAAGRSELRRARAWVGGIWEIYAPRRQEKMRQNLPACGRCAPAAPRRRVSSGVILLGNLAGCTSCVLARCTAGSHVGRVAGRAQWTPWQTEASRCVKRMQQARIMCGTNSLQAREAEEQVWRHPCLAACSRC